MELVNHKIAQNMGSDDQILFLLQNKSVSHDKDYYCVFSGSSASKVIFFHDEDNDWNEVFLDNENDVIFKLNNFDEIAINFLIQLAFVSGEEHLYKKYEKLAITARDIFRYPEDRLWLLKYRIQTLYSKYINYKNQQDPAQSKFILNALNYPMVQLILVSNKIKPASPKQWLSQAKSILPATEFSSIQLLINQNIPVEELKDLYNKYVGKLEDRVFTKAKKSLTFLN